MDKANVNHARSKWDWDGISRPAAKAAAISDDPVIPEHHGRKNTREWCKGKEGRPHKPAERLTRTSQSSWSAGDRKEYQACAWILGWDYKEGTYSVRWSCGHRTVCDACGKHLLDPYDHGTRDCPYYQEQAALPWLRQQLDDERARLEALIPAAQQARLEREARWRARRYRKPQVTGPQGYRRPRPGK